MSRENRYCEITLFKTCPGMMKLWRIFKRFHDGWRKHFNIHRKHDALWSLCTGNYMYWKCYVLDN